MKNTIYLLVFLFSLTLLSCGGGKKDTGSVSFGLRFEQTSAPSSMKAAQSAAAAVDICASYGIDFISGTVYNSSNTVIATGGPWACSAHQGTITNIPVGSNLKIEIKGTVTGSVVWQGETTGVTVTADHDTDVGTVTMTYIGSDITPPTISSFTPSGSDIPVTTVITATFSENISAPTINTDTFTLYDNSISGYVNGDVTYDSSTKTATFTPSGNLSYSSNYTAEIMQGAAGVQDLAGWMLQGTSKWNFITEAVPTSAPSVPTGVSAIAGNAQATISWTAATGATSYNIYWSTTSGVTKSTGAPITGATSPYIHTALTNGTTYYYVVTAVNSYGESGESSQVSVTPQIPAPSAPTGVSATAGNGQVTISWNPVTGATSYNIYWSTTTGVAKSNGTKIPGTTSPYTHTGLTNGTTYYYVVTAVNSYGESGDSSQVSATAIFKIPDTNQTTCYNASGTLISCAGTGQDGEYTINAPSYTDNGNGTITDNVTGLTWQKQDDATPRSWTDAVTYCANLSIAGTGWRLPMDLELMNIVDYGTFSPSINATNFPNTQPSSYWSSTAYVFNTTNAWSVDFYGGSVSAPIKTSVFYVRCVRGGQ